jgi:hypothetical protein
MGRPYVHVNTPHISPVDQCVEAQENAAFAATAQADKHISEGRTIADWFAIGEGLAALRERALRRSGSNQPYGGRYKGLINALRDEHPSA